MSTPMGKYLCQLVRLDVNVVMLGMTCHFQFVNIIVECSLNFNIQLVNPLKLRFLKAHLIENRKDIFYFRIQRNSLVINCILQYNKKAQVISYSFIKNISVCIWTWSHILKRPTWMWLILSIICLHKYAKNIPLQTCSVFWVVKLYLFFDNKAF